MRLASTSEVSDSKIFFLSASLKAVIWKFNCLLFFLRNNNLNNLKFIDFWWVLGYNCVYQNSNIICSLLLIRLSCLFKYHIIAVIIFKKQDHQRWGYSTVTHMEQPVYLAIWKDLNKKKRREHRKKIEP